MHQEESINSGQDKTEEDNHESEDDKDMDMDMEFERADEKNARR